MDQYEQWFATFVAKVRGNPERISPPAGTPYRGPIAASPSSTQKHSTSGWPMRSPGRGSIPPRSFFAGFALLLAAIGAYGAASHSVSQQRHEIGIRIAVGGPPGRVRGMVFCQSMTPVSVGVVAGLLGAAGSGRFLKH